MKIKKLIAMFLLILVVFSTMVIDVDAASVKKTQSEAVDWLKAQNGAWYDIDGAYGAQCSDFASAYMNWLVTGSPYGGTYGVYNANYYPTVAGWDTSKWEVIQNYYDFLPQPGDIFVSVGADSNYGHVGVVLSSNISTATIIDQNYVNWNLECGSNAVIHDITWTGAYSSTYYIRPKFANTSSTSISYATIDFDRYYIRNKADGKYLNVDAGIDKDGTIIHTWQYENYHSQVFYIKPASDGYEIAPECSETRVVNPYGWNVESGLIVNLYSRTNDSSQWWKFQPSGDGYIIRNVQNPNVCLDASSSGMVVSNYSGSNSQIWYLEKLCTVSYNANGGSGAPSSHNARAGYKTTLSEQKPTKQCHTFLGWSTSKTATTASWNEKAAVTIYDNTTLYAVWKANHTYDNSCDTICNRCNMTRSITHDYSAATCTAPKTCKVCGSTSGVKLGHTYNNSCDASCNRCGSLREAQHYWAPADCTTPATCYVCEATIGTSLGHTYSHSCDTMCNRCGGIRTVSGHTYSNACDVYCNVCNFARTVPAHKYDSGKITKAATCKEAGVKIYTCTVCKGTKTETIAKTTTHSYKTTTTKATTSKDGKIVKKCSVCSKTTSSTIKYAKTFKLSTTSYTYNGKVKTPTVTVKDSAGKTLKKDIDYTVTYASGRKNVGTYKVTINMKGNYSGTKTLTFKINPQSISKGKFSLSATSYAYNGKVKTPTVTVKTADGTKLTKNTHYTVTYASGRKNVGTYKVTIKGKGNYTGTKTLTFKINPKAASINKLTAGNKKLTVKLNRTLSQSTGYEIQYSTSKSFSNATKKIITNYKTSSKTLTGLKAKKTYYVRVRTYKTVGKTKYYSNWSSYKKKNTK